MPEPRQLSPLFTWRGAVASPESGLDSTTRLTALVLSLHMNERGGSAFPGAALLAGETGLSERSVRDHLARLVAGGWLELVEKGGTRGERRRANAYRATVPAPLHDVQGSADAPMQETARTPASDRADPCTTFTPGRNEVAIEGDNGEASAFTAEVRAITDLIADHVETLHPGARRPTVTTAWLRDTDRLLRLDKRDPVEVRALIAWVHQDDFWASNILSPSKLRKQYDRLVARARQDLRRGRPISAALAERDARQKELGS